MNCSDARYLIHLDVGDDLHAEEKQQLSEHREHCSECRTYYAGIANAMSALMSLRDAPAIEAGTSGDSVWPAVSAEIHRRRTGPAMGAVRKFNLQVVALSVCSLSLAVVTIVQSLSSMRQSMDGRTFMPAQSVSYQMRMPESPVMYPPYSAFPPYEQAGAPQNQVPPLVPGFTNVPPRSF